MYYCTCFVTCSIKEHELIIYRQQVLISGSVDSLDIDDLRNNTNYAGGYHAVSGSSLSAKMPL